jgi:uncharacterized protein (DUF433 family)
LLPVHAWGIALDASMQIVRAGPKIAARVGIGRAGVEMTANQMHRAADELRRRGEDQVGKLEKSRYVVHNKMHIAGTRIPTLAIWNFHRARYHPNAIIEEFPRLGPDDVRAAIEFEEKRQAA